MNKFEALLKKGVAKIYTTKDIVIIDTATTTITPKRSDYTYNTVTQNNIQLIGAYNAIQTNNVLVLQ